MQRILALFDAPAPAVTGLLALAEAGVDPLDVGCVPLPPGAAELARAPLADATDLAALRRALDHLDTPAALREMAVELVRRGGILLLVDAPRRSADLVAGLLDGAGALDPAALAAAWRIHPATTYDWAEVAPPLLDAPGAPDPMPAAGRSGAGAPAAPAAPDAPPL